MMSRLRITLERIVADERGSVWSLVFKLALAGLVIGLIISQGGPILWNQFKVRSIANDAMDIGVNKFRDSRGNIEATDAAIRKEVEDRGARMVGEVAYIRDSSGHVVSISFTIRNIQRTYLFENISFLAPYTEATHSISRDLTY